MILISHMLINPVAEAGSANHCVVWGRAATGDYITNRCDIDVTFYYCHKGYDCGTNRKDPNNPYFPHVTATIGLYPSTVYRMQNHGTEWVACDLTTPDVASKLSGRYRCYKKDKKNKKK